VELRLRLNSPPQATRSAGQPNLVPAVTWRPVWPLGAFTVFDDTRVYVELLSAQVTVTAPSEIVLYARAFEKLSGLAVYGGEARARITES
jgi:hypothetical protein